MSTLIEDYAIIGDTKTVAAVARNGSVDWWCVPRIDSGAVFAALVGEPKHGRWLIAPNGEVTSTRRQYVRTRSCSRPNTRRPRAPSRSRTSCRRAYRTRRSSGWSTGLAGAVPMRLELIARFDYGSVAPWAQATGDGLTLVAASDALRFHSPVPLERTDQTTTAEFTVREGQRRGFSLGVVLGDRGSAAAPRHAGRAPPNRAVLDRVDGTVHVSG